MVVPLGSIRPDWSAVEVAPGDVKEPDVLEVLGVSRVGKCASFRRTLDIVPVCVVFCDVEEIRREHGGYWIYLIGCHSTNDGAGQSMKGQPGVDVQRGTLWPQAV